MPVHLPCLKVEYLADAVEAVVTSQADYSDVLFTSVNGVHAVAKQTPITALCAHKRVAAVGKKTACALTQYGVTVDIVPPDGAQDQDGLIAAYAVQGMPKSLLFFRAESGRDSLAQALEAQHVLVCVAKVYRTVCPQEDASQVIAMMQNDGIDAVLLGSPKQPTFIFSVWVLWRWQTLLWWW